MIKKLALAFIFISIITNFLSFTSDHGWGDDFAAYVIQSKAIVHHDLKGLEAHTHRTEYTLTYPWGLPILLSPVISFFEENIIIIKMYIYLFLLMSLIVVYRNFDDDKENALIACLLVVCNPFFWEFKNNILSEFPNLLFTVLVVFILNSYYVKRKVIFNNVASGLLLGLFAFLSYFTRTQSIILLPLIALIQLFYFKRDRQDKANKLYIYLLPYACFLVLKLAAAYLIPVKGGAYDGKFDHLRVRFLIQTAIDNFYYYINLWSELFSNVAVIAMISKVFTGVVFVLFIIGIKDNFKKNIVYIGLFVFTLGILLFWPYQQGPRFIITLIPFFLYFSVKGLSLVFIDAKDRRLHYLLILVVVLGSLRSIIYLSYQAHVNPQIVNGPYQHSSQQLFGFLKANTEKTSIVGFNKPRAMLLYTGRDAVVPISASDCITRKIDYLVCPAVNSPIPVDSLVPAVFTKVFSNEDYYVYRVNAPASK